jgi:hypothetical protein
VKGVKKGKKKKLKVWLGAEGRKWVGGQNMGSKKIK